MPLIADVSENEGKRNTEASRMGMNSSWEFRPKRTEEDIVNHTREGAGTRLEGR